MAAAAPGVGPGGPEGRSAEGLGASAVGGSAVGSLNSSPNSGGHSEGD